MKAPTARKWPKPIQGWFDFLARQTRPPEHSLAFRVAVASNVSVALASVGISLDWPWFVPTGIVGTWLAMALSYRVRTRNNWDIKAALSIGMIVAMLRFFWTFLTGDISDPRVPLAELLVWLQTLHSFDLPGRRDLNYSLLVALILMSIAAVTSNSMAYGLCLLCYGLTYFVAAAVHVQRIKEESLDGHFVPESSLKPLSQSWRAHFQFSWRWAGFWAKMLALSAVLFLAFPKFQSFKIRALPFSWQPKLNLPRVSRGKVQNPGFPKTSDPQEFRKQVRQNRSQGYAGFNQIVDLQLRGALEPKVALRIRRSKPSYLRGLVFDNYDGQFWTCSDTSTKTLSCLTPPVNLSSGFAPSFSEFSGDETGLELDTLALDSVNAQLIPLRSFREVVTGCERNFFRLDSQMSVSVVCSVYCLETVLTLGSDTYTVFGGVGIAATSGLNRYLDRHNLELDALPSVAMDFVLSDRVSSTDAGLAVVGEYIDTPPQADYSYYSGETVKLLSCFEPPMRRSGHKTQPVAGYSLTNVLEEQVQIISVESELPNVVLASADPQSLYFPGDEVYRDRNGNVLSPYPLELGMLYSVISQEAKEIPDLLDRLSPKDRLGEKQNLRFYQLPENYSKPGTPEFKLSQLSKQLTQGQPNSYRKILALVHYLSQNYQYDVQVDRFPDDSDVAAHFVLTQKRGYCEQFATSLAVMTRCIGLPSRYVTGYLPGSYNPFTGNFEILSSEAHAWTEIYLPNYGWLTFDATPPGQLQRDATLSGQTDSMWVLVWRYLKGSNAQWPIAGLMGFGLLVAGIRQFRTKPVSIMRQALMLCQRHGYPKPAGWTLLRFAKDCKLDSLSELIELHQQAVYRTGDPTDSPQMFQALAKLKLELKLKTLKPRL